MKSIYVLIQDQSIARSTSSACLIYSYILHYKIVLSWNHLKIVVEMKMIALLAIVFVCISILWPFIKVIWIKKISCCKYDSILLIFLLLCCCIHWYFYYALLKHKTMRLSQKIEKWVFQLVFALHCRLSTLCSNKTGAWPNETRKEKKKF